MTCSPVRNFALRGSSFQSPHHVMGYCYPGLCSALILHEDKKDMAALCQKKMNVTILREHCTDLFNFYLCALCV